MAAVESPNVALLIDFENLVIGVTHATGDSAVAAQGAPAGGPVGGGAGGETGQRGASRRPRIASAPVDVAVLRSLAQDHGAVAVSRAYADWRLSAFNRYQTALYREGVDVIHVKGRRGKNSVDLRLAVDAMELLFERSDIQTFVVVTGDRDFLHLFAKLQSQGRTVVLVSPAGSASNDLAHTCDRFITYETLWRTEAGHPSAEMERQLELFNARLALVVTEPAHAGGMVGSRLKVELRRSLGPTFDEMNLGFARFKDLIASCPGVVNLQQRSGASDFVVTPRVTIEEARRLAWSLGLDGAAESDGLDHFIGRARARLGQWRYEWNPGRRRLILEVLYGTMRQADRFTQDDVIASLRQAPEAFGDATPSATQLSRYLSVCYQSTMFVVEQLDRDLPVRARRLQLRKEYGCVDDFIARYEQSILFKVAELLELDDDLAQAASRARAVLGVDDDTASEAYVRTLLGEIRKVASGEPAMGGGVTERS